MPACSATTAERPPRIRVQRVALPTLGRPTNATWAFITHGPPPPAPFPEQLRLLLDGALEEAHGVDAVLDLVEFLIGLGRGELQRGAQVQLVGAVDPMRLPLAEGPALPALQPFDSLAALR